MDTMRTLQTLPLFFVNLLTVKNLIILSGIIFFHVIAYRKKLQKFKRHHSWLKGEKKVSKILKKTSGNRFIVLNDVLLPLYDNTTQVDHIIIGSFGVMCIETKNHSGTITGSAKKKYWTQRIGNRTYSFYNPLLQNNTHVKAVRYLLNKEKLHNVPVHSLVVFSSKKVSVELSDEGLPVITIRYLKKYLKKRTLKKPYVDAEQVANAISKYQITDKSAKKQHIRHLRKAYGQ